jgi:hypothetical protein
MEDGLAGSGGAAPPLVHFVADGIGLVGQNVEGGTHVHYLSFVAVFGAFALPAFLLWGLVKWLGSRRR